MKKNQGEGSVRVQILASGLGKQDERRLFSCISNPWSKPIGRFVGGCAFSIAIGLGLVAGLAPAGAQQAAKSADSSSLYKQAGAPILPNFS